MNRKCQNKNLHNYLTDRISGHTIGGGIPEQLQLSPNQSLETFVRCPIEGSSSSVSLTHSKNDNRCGITMIQGTQRLVGY